MMLEEEKEKPGQGGKGPENGSWWSGIDLVDAGLAIFVASYGIAMIVEAFNK